MGKPFRKELGAIAHTFEWARQADVSSWRKALEINGLSLIAVRWRIAVPGQVRSAAQRAAGRRGVARGDPFRGHTGHCESPQYGGSRHLVHCRGRNPDILSAYRALVRLEPERILVVCSSVGSPLSKMAQSYDEGSVLEFECPAGKDGFLATNSLLATATLLLLGSRRRNGIH